MNKKPALLITNLGTPDSPGVGDVGKYLREFLLDKYVLTMPSWIRWILVHCLILPLRTRTSAKNYRKIWTDRGSPLLFHSRDFANQLRQQVDFAQVYLAMRYGSPSLEEQLRLIQRAGHQNLWLWPLYPQYAESTVATTIERVRQLLQHLDLPQGPNVNLPESSPPLSHSGWRPSLKIFDRFYDRAPYIGALASSISGFLQKFPADYLLFSYHGLPVHHIKKTDPSGQHCGQRASCCERAVEANGNCYRFHCFETTRRVLEILDFPRERTKTSFQSRLGPTAWIQPPTDQSIGELARRGVKRLAVVCPSFVVDCLETLEEIGQGGREIFLHSGGKEFGLIPCLNSGGSWVRASKEMLESHFL